MSKDIAMAFIQRMDADVALQKSLNGLGQGDINGLLKIAATSGYPFSETDWKNALKSISSGELSDEDLSQVSGGLNPQPLPPRYLES